MCICSFDGFGYLVYEFPLLCLYDAQMNAITLNNWMQSGIYDYAMITLSIWQDKQITSDNWGISMAHCYSSVKVLELQVRAAQRSILYFREGIESQNRGLVLQALERDYLGEGRDRRDQMTSQPYQWCGNLVPSSPHTASGETPLRIHVLMSNGPVM